MSDAYIAAARRSMRRSLFQRFKKMGMPQDQIVQNVAKVSGAMLEQAGVADLAVLAAAAGPLRDALSTAAPGDPALATFNAVKDGVGTPVRDLLEP